MAMLNQLPDVYIAGENAGMIGGLYNLYQKRLISIAESTEEYKNAPKVGPWWHHPIKEDLMDNIIRAYVAASIGLSASFSRSSSLVGFKDIHFEIPHLDYLLTLFPCAKVIVNVRRDVAAQHESHFQKRTTIKKLVERNARYKEWADRHSDRVFQIALEDFNAENMTKLANWLGFDHCRYLGVVHTNGGRAEEARGVDPSNVVCEV